MDNKNILPFGQQIKVGNYTVLKFTKTLTKAQLKAIRNEKGIPADVQKMITRSGIPYIKVEALSQIWSVSFCCNTAVFRMIDHLLPLALIADKTGEKVETTLVDFMHLFSMWFTDTSVTGDAQYMADKGNALAALIARQKAKRQETLEEKNADDEVLQAVKADEDNKSAIIDMVKDVQQQEEKGGENGN